jgi:hypothetical protein
MTSRSDLSPQAFLSISAAFQNQILCLDSDFKDSIVVHSLPLALENPTLLHAWVACSVIALSRSMPYWNEKAIKHYDSAVSGLSQALQERPQTDDKWKRETVLLLHLFEVRPTVDTDGQSLTSDIGIPIKRWGVCSRESSSSWSTRAFQHDRQRQDSYELP